MGKSKDAMVATTWGVVVRSGLLFLLSFFNIGLWGLIIAVAINVLVVTFYDIFKVRKYLKR